MDERLLHKDTLRFCNCPSYACHWKEEEREGRKEKKCSWIEIDALWITEIRHPVITTIYIAIAGAFRWVETSKPRRNLIEKPSFWICFTRLVFLLFFFFYSVKVKLAMHNCYVIKTAYKLRNPCIKRWPNGCNSRVGIIGDAILS